VSHETHDNEQGPAALAADVEPTVLSYREFCRREHLRAWYRRRREQELTGVVYPSARPAQSSGVPPA
jgi:hypothetical protein